MAIQPHGRVTLLFTDVEGSTRILERLGAERYATAIERQRQLLRSAFESRRGYVVDNEGDAFFVTFADAAHALAAAEAAQRALHQSDWGEDGPLRVRMGIHTGDPLVVGSGYVGIDVHRAARIMAAAHGGQVVLSETTRAAVSAVAVRDLGEHRLKDLLQPIRLFQLEIDGLGSEFPALKSLGAHPTNLPVQPSRLVGRERELEELVELVVDGRHSVTTVTGTGGVGKTRLALHVAAEAAESFDSGVFLVSLNPVLDPAGVVEAIASALGLREVPGETWQETLAAYLEPKRMLIVLDNFEHVLEAAAGVASLASGCEGVRVLVTSRERLRLSGERVYPVEPLPVDDAIVLFTERAQAIAPHFEPSPEEHAVVGAVCRALDNLPLAVELAAPRVAVLPPAQLLDRLDDRLKLLAGGARDVEPRQRALRATIEWSYELLSSPERSAFQRLAVFIDGGRLEATDALLRSLDADALDTLSSLVEKNLVNMRRDSDGMPRYWMFETIRAFANECSTSDCREVAARLHAEYFHGVARLVEWQWKDAAAADWVERLEADWPNIRAAFEWLLARGDVERALELAVGLGWIWRHRGRTVEGTSAIERCLELGPDTLSPTYARALATLGIFAHSGGHNRVAVSHYEAALPLLEQTGQVEFAGLARSWLATSLLALDELDRAEELLEEIAQAASADGNDMACLNALSGLAELAAVRGDRQRAMELLDAHVEFARTRLHKRNLVISINNASGQLVAFGEFAKAERLLREAVDLEGVPVSVRALADSALAELLTIDGRFDEADVYYARSLEHGGDPPPPWFQVSALIGCAARERAAGRDDRAARYLGAAALLRADIEVVSAAEATIATRYLAGLEPQTVEADEIPALLELRSSVRDRSVVSA